MIRDIARIAALTVALVLIITARAFQVFTFFVIQAGKFTMWVSVCLALLATRIAEGKKGADELRESLYAAPEEKS